jgi:hypothetical protein
VDYAFSKYGMTSERNVGKPGRHVSNAISRVRERKTLRKEIKTTERGVVCTDHGKRKDTVYCCREYDVGLCSKDCSEAYNKKLN